MIIFSIYLYMLSIIEYIGQIFKYGIEEDKVYEVGDVLKIEINNNII